MADEVVHVAGDEVSVEIIPGIGARIHRLEAFGHDVLRTPPSVEEHRRDPFSWGAYIMAPWCNRAPAGRLRLSSHRSSHVVDLEPNFADGTAIHGLVHDRPWVRVGPAAWRIDHHAGRWPWHHAARVEYSVVGTCVVVELAVENHDDTAMPAGVGWHPWFRSPVEVTIPASVVFESNIASSAEPVPVTGAFERRRAGTLDPGIDATWTQLDGRQVELAWPDLETQATLTMSDAVGFVVAAAPADRHAVAVEPQTHGPDGLRRLVHAQSGAPTWLSPGGSVEVRLELSFRQR